MKTKLYCTLLAAIAIITNTALGQTLVKKMSSVSGGDVYAVYKNGSSYFIGGTFNYVGLNTGYGALTKTNNDYPDMNFPNFNGQISVVIPDNGTGWYVGGSFSSVGGVGKSNLVHVKADFSIDPSFTANTNGEVRTIFKVGGRLYIGGTFSTVNGTSRSYAAAVNATTGALVTAWNPSPNSYVNTITAVYAADTTIWLGGYFTTINTSGLSRPYLAKVNSTNGNFVSGSMSANYIVNKLVTKGDSVFIGGQFSSLGLKTDYLGAIAEGSSKPDQTMPNANGSIRCVIPDGSGGWYVGGAFTQIGGVNKSYAAHILSNKTVDQSFTANCNSYVLTMVKDGSRLYLGGQFTTVNSTGRNYLAAVNATTGALVAAWDANANSYVYTLALQNDLVLAGGSFTNIKGKTAYRFGALNKTNGTPESGYPGYNSTVNKIAVRGDSILVGGSYYEGANYSPYSAKLTTSSITLDPNFPATNGAINSVVPDGAGNYYVAGSFTTIGGVNQAYVAKLNSSLAVVTGWAPSVNGQVNTMVLSGSTLVIGGRFTTTNAVSRIHISALNTANPGNNKIWNSSMNTYGYVNTLALDGTDVYAGGTFTLVNGITTRNRLAKFDLTGNLNASWDPNASGGGSSVEEIAISGTNILAGGSFTSIGGIARNYLAKLNNTNGNSLNWTSANSYVFALNVDGTTCYVGGYFTSLTSSSGTLTSRNYIGGITISNGNINSFNPSPNSYVYTIKKAGTNVFFGGQFSTVAGADRKYVASASSTNGAVQSWNPSANYIVNSLFIDGTNVFLGGSFTGFQQVSRTYASVIRSSTKAFAVWAPSLDNAVYDITYNGSRILIGGIFRNANGSARNAFAAFNLNGTLVGTNLNLTKGGGSYVTVRSIYASSANSNVYIGGDFDKAGSVQRNNFVEADITTGVGTVLATSPYVDQDIYSIHVNGNNIVYGGDFRFSNFTSRTYLGVIKNSTGTLGAWNPIPSYYVYDIAINYNRIFVVGAFDQVNGATHTGAAAFTLSSGALLTWDPQLSRSGYGIYADLNAVAADSNNVYLGGYFDQARGQSRSNAAAVSASTAALQTWNPGPSYIVNTLGLNGTNLFLGGNFTFCKGASRSYLAKIDSATGLVDASWNPGANSYVYALTSSGANLYVGGRFTTIGGIARNSLAAVNMTTAAVTGFNPDIKYGGSQGTVNTLAFDESANLYVGGSFNTAKTSTRNNVASYTVAGAGTLRTWDPNANGDVNSIAINGTTVYLGGQFTTLAGGTIRNRLASVNNTTGALLAFNPNMNSYVHRLTVSGTNLYVGGQFTSVNGGVTTRNYLAAYNTGTGNLATWNPVANSYVFALAASADTVFPGGYYTTLNGSTRNRLAGVRAAAGTALLPFNPDVNSTVRHNYISGRVMLSGGDFTTIGGANRSGFAVFILPGGTTSKSAITTIEDNFIAKAPQNQFALYPNPSNNGVVTVRLNEKISGRVTIKITTMDGKQVYQKAYDIFNKSDLLTLRAENLTNGSYIVNVIGTTTNWKQTLIINK